MLATVKDCSNKNALKYQSYTRPKYKASVSTSRLFLQFEKGTYSSRRTVDLLVQRLLSISLEVLAKKLEKARYLMMIVAPTKAQNNLDNFFTIEKGLIKCA